MEAAALSQTAGLILKLLVPPLSKKIMSIHKNEEEIKLLAETIEYIGDVLSDVEGKEFKEESANTAYRRLREAFLDAEDFLDRVQALKKKKDFETMIMKKAREEIISKNGKGKRSLAFVRIKIKPYKNKARRFFSSSNQAKYALEMHKVITNIRKNLDNISQDLRKFGLEEPSSISKAAHISARATGSNASTGIIGRDEDMRITVDLLLRSSVDRNKIPVVSIVGIGGIGKTTLAQLVYKSMEQSCKFDMQMWVSDSKNYDFKSLLKHILQSICPNDTGLEQLEEDHLRQRLVERIHGKRFLLVLDDVDDEDQFNWENFEALLNNGDKEGSRILLTTRSRKVVSVTGSSNSAHVLEGLVEEEAVQLFEKYAFRERMAEDLVEIGKHIVQKCHGAPLALKVIGSYLNDKDKRKWEFVRDHSFADIADEGKQLLSVLKISYDDLDPTLKRCFSLCALFPKNYNTSKEMLSFIWRANVRFKTENGETLEDVCDKNMRILYNRCFLEASLYTYDKTLYEWDDFDRVKMHDLMHDLAQKVAGAEILVVDSNAKVESGRLIAAKEENVRHLFVTARAPAIQPEGMRLRTFLHSDDWHPEKVIFWDDKIVSECPNLRLLDISRRGIESLTKSIGKLIQLRYLGLSHNEFQTLPDSITELINLSHLDLSGCKALTHLPSRIGALTSLQVLNLSYCGALKELPRGIAKLVKLRMLLVGWSRLTRMPCEFGALTSLEVLDMCGCDNLERLPWEIENLVNLRHLELPDCKALTHLPSEMGGLASLEMLDVSHCFKLKELPRCIEKLVHLRSLKLVECCALTHLPSGLGALRSLKVLDMSKCDKMEDLPREIENLANLRHLGLSGCEALTHLPSGMGELALLKTLNVSHCFELKELPRSIEKLVHLRSLELVECCALTHLPSGLGALRSLKLLDMSKCDKLEDLPKEIENLVHLRRLELSGCKALTHLPLGLAALTSLEVLDITHCDKLKELPRGIEKLIKLKKLSLYGCDALAQMPSGMGALLPICDPHRFIVGPLECNTAQLEELGPLSDLAEHLTLELQNGVTLKAGEGGEPFLLKKRSLMELNISWQDNPKDEVPNNHAEILEKLQPPTNLETLYLNGYQGIKIPAWVPQDGSASALPNLASLNILNCGRCRHLHPLTRLPHLKYMELRNMSSLEYIEDNASGASVCLPELETLVLDNVPQLKGLYRGPSTSLDMLEDDLAFLWPNLVSLNISNCGRCRLLHPLTRLPHLKNMELRNMSSLEYIEDNASDVSVFLPELEKLVLENLPQLKGLYKGPSTSLDMSEDDLAFLWPNLVSLDISNCNTCRHLSPVNRLKSLRYLKLSCLSSLEYIEEDNVSAEPFCLPQLDNLVLENLPDLKGLCGGVQSWLLSSFPRLSRLFIYSCPDLTAPPLLSFLNVIYSNVFVPDDLRTSKARKTMSLDPSHSHLWRDKVLADARIEHGSFTLSMREDSLSLQIRKCNAPEEAETLTCMSDHLRVLVISSCSRVKTFPGSQHLAALQELHIKFCHDFTWEEDEEDSSHSFNGLKSLKCLSLEGLPNMARLPEGLQFVTSLQELHICNCKNLLIPEWLQKSFICEMGNYSDEFHWVRKETEGCSPTSSSRCSFFI